MKNWAKTEHRDIYDWESYDDSTISKYNDKLVIKVNTTILIIKKGKK